MVPFADLRHRLAAAASRAIFILGGIPARCEGLKNLPEGNAVVVANHASFVDGMLLKGYLPYQYSFVIKGEMRNIPVAHFLLRRSGSKFVERHEQTGSSRDARKIVKAALEGESLAFFPEGTFRREPGVGRFRAGAFVAAIRGDLPVVPGRSRAPGTSCPMAACGRGHFGHISRCYHRSCRMIPPMKIIRCSQRPQGNTY